MQLNIAKRDVQIQGKQLESNVFSIEMNESMFRLLADGLYSNKPLAVIRELSCNAVDAHYMADNLKPFDVQMPTRLEPVFRIRDYGTGMSHETVMDLYTRFGASDKRDSNNLIGGLGVGSKSPLAYTNAFTVNSYYNGESRAYSVFIQDDGRPAINHVHTQQTNEVNGVEIVVPVKAEDIHTFNEQARSVYKYFLNIQPNFVGHDPGVEFTKYETYDAAEGWGWRSGWHTDGVIAVMGNIGYPINTAPLANHADWKKVEAFFNTNLDIRFDIGTLAIAASREALSYNPATINTIIKRALRIIKQQEKSTIDAVKAAKNEWEARKILGEAAQAYQIWNGNKQQEVDYKGKTITQEISMGDNKLLIENSKLTDTNLQLKRVSVPSMSAGGNIQPNRLAGILVIDSSVRIQARIRTFCESVGGLEDGRYVLCVSGFGKDAGKRLRHMMAVFKGAPTPVKLSSVDPDDKYINNGVRIVRNTVQMKELVNLQDESWSYYVEDKLFDRSKVTGKIYYVVSRNNEFTLELNGNQNSIDAKPLRDLYLNYVDKKADSLLVIPASRLTKKIKDDTDMVDLSSVFFEEKMFNKIKEDFSLSIKKVHLIGQIKREDVEQAKWMLANVITEKKQVFEISQYINAHQSITNDSIYTKQEKALFDSLQKFMAAFTNYHRWGSGGDFIIDKHVDLKLSDLIKNTTTEFFDKYPMLQHVRIDDKQNVSLYKDYMNLIDNG